MTAQTGRTTSQWTAFMISDTGDTVQEIAVNTIGGVGLNYPQTDLTAFMDAVRGVLPETPDFVLSIGGPWDSTATTGSHTVLSGLHGDLTPRTLDIQFGVRHAWEATEPQFGISGTAANGVLVTSYMANPDDGTYTAEIRMYPGSAAPAWGGAAET